MFLLDKFCVGDGFYHEITMLVDGLPKSYLVKQRRDQLNKMCHIISTPGEEHGAQLPFKELLKNRIKEYIQLLTQMLLETMNNQSQNFRRWG